MFTEYPPRVVRQLLDPSRSGMDCGTLMLSSHECDYKFRGQVDTGMCKIGGAKNSGFHVGGPAVSISHSNFMKMKFSRTQTSSGAKRFDGTSTREYQYKTRVRLYSFKTGQEIYVQVDDLREEHAPVLISQEAGFALGLIIDTDIYRKQISQRDRIIQRQREQIQRLLAEKPKNHQNGGKNSCHARCNSGERCRHPQKFGKYCGRHKRKRTQDHDA